MAWPPNCTTTRATTSSRPSPTAPRSRPSARAPTSAGSCCHAGEPARPQPAPLRILGLTGTASRPVVEFSQPVADGKRVPEKSSGLLRADAPVAERCAVIGAEKATYKISWMCRLLGVPRSSFYAWCNRAETATAARRRELAAEVRRVFEEGRGAYGCRRVAAQLNRDGHP